MEVKMFKQVKVEEVTSELIQAKKKIYIYIARNIVITSEIVTG
jgi:hypothetical protein